MKLKPCPFCGGGAILKDYSDGKPGSGSWMISCEDNCGVLMATYAKKSHTAEEIHDEIHDNVIKAWNRRVRQ